MDFLNINGMKLKVTLSAEECAAYHIDTDRTDYSGGEVKRAIREILSAAERECDFKADGDRVLVQMFPLPDARCEVLVTRLNGITRRDRAELSSTNGLALIEEKHAVFRFSEYPDLLRAVRLVYREGIVSDLYIDDLGRYYIHAKEEITDGISELEIFTEFGDRLHSLPLAILSEYGTLLAKGDALDRIHRGEIDSKT